MVIRVQAVISYRYSYLFGKIDVGQGLCPCRLSNIGEIINHEVVQLATRFPQMEVAKYVIMPNHVHLLLNINEFDQREKRQGQSPCPTIGNIVGAFKSITTKKANKHDGVQGRKIWQFRFHNHIIHNDAEYQSIRQ